MADNRLLLFNFSVSYSGGGQKRLCEYAKWFDVNGGATFIVHPQCRYLADQFPRNRFFVVSQTWLERLFREGSYLNGVMQVIGEPDFYYSYGIPVYSRVGRVNWFHLSNVLPLALTGVPLSTFERLKLPLLGQRIASNWHNADVISAESRYSLSIIGDAQRGERFLSVNGSDDELVQIAGARSSTVRNIATIVGTYRYKALDQAMLVFDMLKQAHPGLELHVIGNATPVPGAMRERSDVKLHGLLNRAAVINILRESKFYISMTRIENSYNAASEGVFLAEESYISDIGPHRELLAGEQFSSVEMPEIGQSVLHVRRKDVSGTNLIDWNTVVSEMMAKFEVLRSGQMEGHSASLRPTKEPLNPN